MIEYKCAEVSGDGLLEGKTEGGVFINVSNGNVAYHFFMASNGEIVIQALNPDNNQVICNLYERSPLEILPSRRSHLE